MKKLVAVFGPGECRAGDDLYDSAEALGVALAQAGFVVLSGGYGGVMEAVSKGARSVEGAAVGVTAEVYFARGREANSYLTREIRVNSATDRMMELLDLADAYIAIGNSTGTLAEIAVAWDYMLKGFYEQKPLLVIGESWSATIEAFKSNEQFTIALPLIAVVPTPHEAVSILTQTFGPQHQLPDLTVLTAT